MNCLATFNSLPRLVVVVTWKLKYWDWS